MVHIEMVDEKVLLAGLLGAITWNLITLVLGLPTSSSHALMGGYGGAAVAKSGFGALILSGWTMPVLFIFLAPVIGLFVGAAVTIVTSWIVRNQRPRRVDKWFRRLQLLSAAGYSLGHGTNDAQKGMGIITTALVAGGALSTYAVPYWVILCCHLAMAGGTMAGGWRIIKTMGQRITKLTPFGGFAAESAGALTLIGYRAFWHSGKHHAYDYRCDCGSGRYAKTIGGALGRDQADCYRVGADDTRRGGGGGGGISRDTALVEVKLSVIKSK